MTTSKRLFATIQEKEANLDTIRSKVLAESKSEKQMRPRYGMFSYTGWLAIGENSLGVKRIPERDPDTAKPKTGPKNFQTSPSKKGGLSNAYFGKPNYLAVGDPYIDPLRQNNTKTMQRARSMAQVHDHPFRVSLRGKPQYLPYPHMPERREHVFTKRIDRGEVATAPKNFMTNPPKKGNPAVYPNTSMSPRPQYAMGDDYEAERKRDFAEHRANRNKMQEQVWRDVSPGNRQFAKEKESFGRPDESKLPATTQPSARNQLYTKSVDHDKPFKYSSPGKRGQVGVTIGKHPTHIGNPIHVAVRQPKPDDDAPPKWRNSYRDLSKPSPSVQQLPKNIMSEVRGSIRK